MRRRPRIRCGAVSGLVLLIGCGGSSPSSPGAGGATGLPSRGAAGLAGGGAGGDGTSLTEAGALSGRLARYYRDDPDRSVRFELDAVAGLGPYASSTEYLEELTGRLLNKPDGVSFETDETLSPMGEGYEWTFEALDALARSLAADDALGPVTIQVLFVDGRYVTEDDAGTVLGLAWGERFIALFQEQLRSSCEGRLVGALQSDACATAERNVWAHELGHVIGLVDNGVPLQSAHRDAAHGRHDVSDACIMYWAYDGPGLFDTLLSRFNAGQSQDIDFCEHCWADVASAR